MKQIPGYEGRYSATEDGKIFSHLKNRFLCPYIGRRGYKQVTLSNPKGKKLFTVHRLVCLAYHGIPTEDQEVNHINFNRTDNRAENLEWVSHSENCKKSFDAGRYKQQKYASTLGCQKIARERARKIYAVDKYGNKLVFNSLAEARHNGFSAGNICLCLHGKRKTHKGYRWFFDEN